MPATAGAAPASARGRETAGIGQGVEMVVGIAEQRVDRGQSLERMADLIFGRYPDRTVKLDGLLADEPTATPDLNLCRGEVEQRSEERRFGKVCFITCSFWW